MTRTTNRHGIYEVDHTKFGGTICISDFNTDNRGKNNTNGSPIAKRIMEDWGFDKQCIKNKENTERNKLYDK